MANTTFITGKHSIDTEVARNSLDALCSLLKFNLEQFLATKKFGLEYQMRENPKCLNVFSKFAFAHWSLRFKFLFFCSKEITLFLLSFIFYEDFPPLLMDYLSDCMFYLILAEQNNFIETIKVVIFEKQDRLIQQRLEIAFQNLLTSNRLQLIKDVTNLRIFRKNFEFFFGNVKTFSLTK